jgi:hypothetical protein
MRGVGGRSTVRLPSSGGRHSFDQQIFRRNRANPVFLSALWLFFITKAMIAIGVGALALLIAGACVFAHRYALKPL